MSSDSKRAGPEPIVPVKDGDAFWLTDLYPDPKALFDHEQVSLEVASRECIVVLDANVLLLPFEFTSASIVEMERVYRELSADGRLVVPGQSAREFYKNRSTKITAIADAIDAAITKSKKQIFEKSIPLLEKDPDYMAARELGRGLVKKGMQVAEKLQVVNERLKDEVGADPVSLLYRTLLGGCVSDFSVDPKDRDAVSNEVSRRARLRIAPGYKDQQKEDGGIGDYLVWQTILQEGKKHKVHCIFVTEEEKPDWWVKRHGTFQPRPELIEEYRRASGGKSFHLLPLSGLLSLFKANEDVVQQVQELEERRRSLFDVMQHKEMAAVPDDILAYERNELRRHQRQIDEYSKRLSQIQEGIAIERQEAADSGYDEHIKIDNINRLELMERQVKAQLSVAEHKLDIFARRYRIDKFNRDYASYNHIVNDRVANLDNGES